MLPMTVARSSDTVKKSKGDGVDFGEKGFFPIDNAL